MGNTGDQWGREAPRGAMGRLGERRKAEDEERAGHCKGRGPQTRAQHHGCGRKKSDDSCHSGRLFFSSGRHPVHRFIPKWFIPVVSFFLPVVSFFLPVTFRERCRNGFLTERNQGVNGEEQVHNAIGDRKEKGDRGGLGGTLGGLGWAQRSRGVLRGTSRGTKWAIKEPGCRGAPRRPRIRGPTGNNGERRQQRRRQRRTQEHQWGKGDQEHQKALKGPEEHQGMLEATF